MGTPRQLEKKVYIRNGAIYITRVEYLVNENKIISDQPIIYEMSKNSSIDINEPLDLIMAEILENHE
jgi:CMP-N-acetylneuraminic acid synthetase